MSDPIDPPVPPAARSGECVPRAAEQAQSQEAGLLGYASGVEFPVEAGKVLEAYQHGGTLVARNGATLPPRCILCGGEGHKGPVRLTFTWDSSFHVSQKPTLELRQQARIYAYLCVVHRRIWSRARFWGGIGAAAGMSIMFTGLGVGVWSESSDVPKYTPLGIGLTIVGFAVVIASLFFLVLRSRTLTCRRIEAGYLYLEGAAEEFVRALAALPQKETAPSSKG